MPETKGVLKPTEVKEVRIDGVEVIIPGTREFLFFIRNKETQLLDMVSFEFMNEKNPKMDDRMKPGEKPWILLQVGQKKWILEIHAPKEFLLGKI